MSIIFFVLGFGAGIFLLILFSKKEKKKFVDKIEAKTIAITEFIENRINDAEAEK